ncbi:MAG: phenylacetate--CoA ligase family protein [Bacteroidota bacterium]
MKHLPPIELESPEKIQRLQLTKLAALLRYLNAYSPYYKRLFSTHHIDVDRVSTWQDLARIPVTTKDDLQQYNADFLCVPRQKIVEYTSTSGTLGKPVTIALTHNDVQRLAYNECISFACADGDELDLFQLMLTLDRQFMAGIAYYEGIRKLGAGIIRVGPGLPALQWETIDRLSPTALVAVPSFLLKLIEYATSQGIDLNRSSVKKAICIGESIRTPDLQLNAMGKKIADNWNIRLYGTYASTEMQTAFTECGEGSGGHLHPELIIVEILDEYNNPANPGEPGEVTVTTLGVEGMPLLRYKTGDIVQAHEKKCSCGRSTTRLGPVIGRKQQMIKLKGTTLYPPAIFDILNQIEHVHDYVVEVSTGEFGTDALKVSVLTPNGKQHIENAIRSMFQSRLRVVPDIQLVSQPELERLQSGGGRKVKKFIDNRK